MPLEGQEPQPRRGWVVGGVDGTGKVDWRDSGEDIVVIVVLEGNEEEKEEEDRVIYGTHLASTKP